MDARPIITRTWIPGLLCVLVACGPSVKTPPTSAPAAAATATAPALRIVLAPADDGATATFELGEPRSSLSFAARGNVRRDSWTASTEGLVVDERGLSARAPFSTAIVRLPFDPQEHDRTYPAVTRVGSGAAVYVPALLVEELELEFAPAEDGVVVWPPLQAPFGYSYVGAADDIRIHGDIRLVGFDAIPLWLGAAIEREVDVSLQYYADKLGRSTSPPTIIVSDQSPGPMHFHGDVTDNSVIFLRFSGESWQAEDPSAAQLIAKFVRHEAFHLWNRNHDESAPPWLHEGGAEYAALVAAVTAGVLSEDDARARLSSHLSRCLEHVGDGALAEVRTGSDVYDCGVTLQWLADLHLRRESKGARTIFDLWSQLLSDAGQREGYTVAAFVEPAGELARAFTDDQPGRWTRLATLLPAHDVTVSDAPTDDAYRSAVLRHLVIQACGPGPVGYWTEPDYVRLDTDERCGALDGQPRIAKVGGHTITRTPAKAFAVVAKACTRGRDIVVTTVEGAQLKVACAEPVVLPPTMTVVDSPAIATP